jgi:hypothetical protein
MLLVTRGIARERAATGAPSALWRRGFSLVLVCVLLSVVVLCPLYASLRTLQSCDAAETTDTALMICVVSAAILTETLILAAFPLFARRLFPSFPSLPLLLRKCNLDYEPPPGGVKAAFLIPLRI